ncbi:response regulator receiver domain [Rubrivivax sp. JA1024]|nr:response regulator receiver domain [Rubrivivax sp. JA1024]
MSVDYNTAVQKTFISSLRSVFLVDDSFPTYEDMFGGRPAIEKFSEWERAKMLYAAFREQHLPCDIENSFTPGNIEMVERLRKCDLIVIDFHLTPGSNDGSQSIEILRKLADSPHFNTVIVYTNAERDDVWLDIAANLRPDLRLDPFLDENESEADWWYDADEENLVKPTGRGIAAFLKGGYEAIDRKDRTEVIESIRKNGGSGKGNLGKMAEMVFRDAVDKRRPTAMAHYDAKDTLGARSLQGNFGPGKPYWLQSSGCFITIVKKTDEKDEAAVLMNCLEESLLDWNPNFLQILVSEIQNALELDSVATDPKVFSDRRRQVALSHYLMERLAEDGDADSAVEAMVDRIVETIRHRIAADEAMRGFATEVLSDIRKKLGPQIETNDKVANAAALAHVFAPVEPIGVVSFLNAFLSTERFAKTHITTGTVFSEGNHFWMVATPACDLTSRIPTSRQAWMKSMHPVRALTAIRLEKVNAEDALENATHGRHAFVLHDGEPLCLAVLDRTTSAPDTEMFFALEAGKVKSANGRATFRAVRVGQLEEIPKLTDPIEYSVVGQLRPNYASRILQVTGAHLSRIGIDFFNRERPR